MTLKSRLLVFVDTDSTPVVLAALLEEVQSVVQDTLGLEAEFISSKDWYAKMFPRYGSWEACIWETASGQCYATRTPHFDGFILARKDIGKADAHVMKLALKNGKPVLQVEKNLLLKVKGVQIAQQERKASWIAIHDEVTP